MSERLGFVYFIFIVSSSMVGVFSQTRMLYPLYFKKLKNLKIQIQIFSLQLNEYNYTAIKLLYLNQSHARLGTIYIYLYGTWGTICSVNFDAVDLGVLCLMLGYKYAISLK